MMMVGNSNAGAALRGPYGVMIKAATWERETTSKAAADSTFFFRIAQAENKRRSNDSKTAQGKKALRIIPAYSRTSSAISARPERIRSPETSWARNGCSHARRSGFG